jgi:hypothetical protein
MLKGQGELKERGRGAITEHSGIGSALSGDSSDDIMLFNPGSVLVRESHLVPQCMAPI